MKNKFIKTKNIILFSFIFLLFISLVLTNFTKADTTTTTSTCPPGTYYFETGVPFFAKQGECKSSSGLQNMISSLIKKLFPIAGILAFAMIVFAGFEYATSGGDTNKQKDAQDRIANAIIGLILLFAFWIIIYTINPDILKTQNISLPTVTTSSTSNILQQLPVQYIQQQTNNLNKLIAAATIIVSPYPTTIQSSQANYERLIDTSTIPTIQYASYLPTILFFNKLHELFPDIDLSTTPFGASCDYYVAVVMRTSGLDPNYPAGNVDRQYNYIRSNSKFDCTTIPDHSGECPASQGDCKNASYLTQTPSNGSIIFYDHNQNCCPDHTALWINGKRLQASNGEFYPADRGSTFNPSGYPILAICTYKG